MPFSIILAVPRPFLLARSPGEIASLEKVENYICRIFPGNFFPLEDIFFSDNDKNFEPILPRTSSSPREEAIRDVICSSRGRDEEEGRERESAYPLMELRLFSVARQPIGGRPDEKRATSGIYCPLSIPIWNS